MSVQYLSNKEGQVTAVQIPIEEWEFIKDKFPDIDTTVSLPQWQKEMIDSRLASIEKNPERIHSIEGLMQELDNIE